MPDPVLVERVCAFVVCAPGEPLTFDEMIAVLKEQRMAAWGGAMCVDIGSDHSYDCDMKLIPATEFRVAACVSTIG